MSKPFKFPTLIVAGVIAVVFLGGIVGWGFSLYNTEATDKNLYDMKLVDNNNQYDDMWKEISQSIQIADEKKDAFKEIYAQWSAGTADSGKVMMWLKQAAPDVKGLDVYDKVFNLMTSKRSGFTSRQQELIAIATPYNLRLVTQPSGFVLKIFGFQKIEPKIVTSTRTNKAFETGVDDDTSLTPTKK